MTEQDQYEDKVERLAKKILHGGDGNHPAAPDMETARKVARRLLEDSEERTREVTEEEHDADVIRRTSSETAATGENPVIRRTGDGE